MRPFRGVGWVCALGLLAGAAPPAEAAWNNVFQVCCFGCKKHRSVSCYAPAPACCPQPVCTTQYVQRCYYQPVTCYQTKSYYEQVTSYRTSYYYEPVTSYRYSCYYDPCTCSYQQVACPTTCYRLRSQCCPVTSWVQRCCQVPVTTYQQSFYWEPVTTCCSQPVVAADPCPPNGGAAPAVTEQAQPALVAPAAPAVPPAVSEGRAPAAAAPEPPRTNGVYDRYYPAPQSPAPPASGSSYRAQPPAPPRPAPPPPRVKLDRIVSLPRGDGGLQGQVVHNDNSPRGWTKLLFVRADRRDAREPVTADAAGRFRVDLASGGWLVYMSEGGSQPVFHSKIDVRPTDNRQVILVSR